METKETYTFEFQMFYFNTDNFKQKDAEMVINCISGSQIGGIVSFNSYGHIDYQDWDKPHRYPTVSYLESFNRNKTNCLIFDVADNDATYKNYNKLFIYFTNGHNIQHYGFVLYNTETGDTHHRFSQDYDYAELTRQIKRSLYMNRPKDSVIAAFKKLADENANKTRKDGTISADKMIYNIQKTFCKEKGLNILKYAS